MYGAVLGLAHLMVNNKVSMVSVTTQHKDAVMSVFTALTKRTVCELGSCCTDIAEFIDALENPAMQRLATNLGLWSQAWESSPCEAERKASIPDKFLELRGSKAAHLLKNAAVSVVVAQNRRNAARFQGITSGSKQVRGARAPGSLVARKDPLVCFLCVELEVMTRLLGGGKHPRFLLGGSSS